MSSTLKKAQLVPMDLAGKRELSGRAIHFDFNPESLRIEVKTGRAADRGRRGRQQVQHVGRALASLSFEAIFDSTHPESAPQGDGAALDVREKTRKIEELVRAVGRSGKEDVPRPVLFAWGTVRFRGLLKSFHQTLEHFSPEGVPLRARVTVSLDEQDYRYRAVPEAQAQRRGAAADAAEDPPDLGRDAAALAEANELDSLFDLTEGQGFAPREDLEAPAGAPAPPSLSDASRVLAELGGSAELPSVAGTELTAAAGIELFGAAALAPGLGGEVDLGLALPRPVVAPRSGASAWAPEGPAPGSRAAADAAALAAGAPSAGATAAPPPSGSGAPAIGEGRAPTGAPRPTPLGSPPARVLTHGRPAPGAVFDRRPRGAGGSSVRAGARKERTARASCGCAGCRGGGGGCCG